MDLIGYLVIQPSLVELLFYDNDLAFLADRGTKLAILTDEETDDDLRNRFSAVGIPVRAIYSSQEVGFIGAECKDCPGVFHIAQSNVIIEVDNRDSVTVGSNVLGACRTLALADRHSLCAVRYR